MTNPLFTAADLAALAEAEAEKDRLTAETAAIDRAADIAPVVVDPDVAEAMAAFEETALSEEDALDALFAPEGLEGDDE